MSNEMLRALVDLRDRQIQKARIQFGNRVAALESGADTGRAGQLEVAQRWHDRFSDLEKELDRDIAREVAEFEIYDYVKCVRGIGPMMAAKLISMIDIEKAPTISALWRYAGYAVIDGKRERPVKGERLHYNKRLKTACYLVGQSFLRSNSPYRDEYDRARVYYDRREDRKQAPIDFLKEDLEVWLGVGADDNTPAKGVRYAEKKAQTIQAKIDALPKPWTDGHRHNAALRKMVKLFLSHLWLTWRQLEGLPTREPYSSEYLDHTSIELPGDYGWPEVERVNTEDRE